MSGKPSSPAQSLIKILVNDLEDSKNTIALPSESVQGEGGDAVGSSGDSFSVQKESETSEIPQNSPDPSTPQIPQVLQTPPIHLTPQMPQMSSSHGLQIPQMPQTPQIPSGGPSSPLPSGPSGFSSPSGSSFEVQLIQAENLRLAQEKILSFEKELEALRRENEVLVSMNEIAKQRIEDLVTRVQILDREKIEVQDQGQMEVRILKDTILQREKDSSKLKIRVEELEKQIQSDLKKIRVRERELENRLELTKTEKTALMRIKDEVILELKRKMEDLNYELESYKSRCRNLNVRIDSNHEQLSRTVRALRLALANLEGHRGIGSESNSLEDEEDGGLSVSVGRGKGRGRGSGRGEGGHGDHGEGNDGKGQSGEDEEMGRAESSGVSTHDFSVSKSSTGSDPRGER